MIKYILKILLFFTIIACVDIFCGTAFNYLKAHAKSGDTQKNYYISEQCKDDIIIMGSSRAVRHYVPGIIQDSLNLSCYNCGEQGCGIITAYARYKLISDRHKPRMIVYEVTPGFDYFKTDDYSKYLGRVRQYADKEVIKNMFIEFGDKWEKVRLLSNMYKNNSFIVHNIMDNILSDNKQFRGFKPLKGMIIDSTIHEKVINGKNIQVDSLMFAYMEKMIIELKGNNIPLLFMVSPRFGSNDDKRNNMSEYSPLIELCMKHEVPFINHTYNLRQISNNSNYFHDFGHMNKLGAEEYTKAICMELKKYLKE